MSEKSLAPQPGPQTEFMQSSADIVIFGGAAGGGKSVGLLLESLRYHQNPAFSCVIFRRSMPDITNPGGLWDESMKIFPLVNGVPKPSRHRWVFPSGAQCMFSHLEYDSSLLGWQGAQVPLVCFDELTTFTEYMFFFMLSRNRSTCGVHPYVRATCNPDAESWVREFIGWWIDEDGYANLSRCGTLRYFLQRDNNKIWGATAAECKKLYGRDLPAGVEPKSVTFIPSSIYDNNILLDINPEYLGNLMALPEREKQRLLGDRLRGGNWNIKAGGTMFRAEWFEIVQDWPKQARLVRRWDLAATAAEKGKDPDWSSGCLMAVHQGVWYIVDMIHERLNPGALERLLAITAHADGVAVGIRMEQEPGASGKIVIDSYARGIFAGFDFKGIPSSGNKEVRARPLSAAAEAGNVKLVAGPWNRAFLNEAESFGINSLHDDQIDAAASAMADLSGAMLRPSVTTGSEPTEYADMAMDKRMQELWSAMTPEERAEAAEMQRQIGE
jgi:predicted phage terminase large subunit-like protein